VRLSRPVGLIVAVEDCKMSSLRPLRTFIAFFDSDIVVAAAAATLLPCILIPTASVGIDGSPAGASVHTVYGRSQPSSTLHVEGKLFR
jgi:hypothetical protein